MPLCKIFLHTQSHLPASQHQFLDVTKIKISSKNWCWLAGKWLHVCKKILKSGIIYIEIIDRLISIYKICLQSEISKNFKTVGSK